MQEIIKSLINKGWTIKRIALYLNLTYNKVYRSIHVEQERERLNIYRKTTRGRKAHNKIALRSYHKRKKK